MSLKNFYGLTDEAFKKMLHDGIIPASRVRDHEIYDEFKKRKVPGKSTEDIVYEISDAMKVSYATVKKAIYSLSTKS